MALGYADSALSLWDLRLLQLPALFHEPFAVSTPNQFAAVNAVLENGPLPQSLKNTLAYTAAVLRYRFRYDIEVGEITSIKPGDFDIEIE